MKKKTQLFNKSVFALTLLFILLTSINLIADPDKFEEAKQLLNDGARTYSVKKLEDAKGIFIELANKDSKNYLFPYYTALTYLEISNIKNFDVDKSQTRAEKKIRKAERVIIASEGEEFIDKSIASKNDFAESHRVKGALIAYKISGMMSGMRFGGQANEQIKLSLKYAPNNPLALIETARKLIFSPAIVGGDLKQGMTILNNVITDNPKLKMAYILLGHAYDWCNDKENAIKTFKALLKINPENPEAQYFLSKLLELKQSSN